MEWGFGIKNGKLMFYVNVEIGVGSFWEMLVG